MFPTVSFLEAVGGWGHTHDQKHKQWIVGVQTTEEKSIDSKPADPERTEYQENLKQHPFFLHRDHLLSRFMICENHS